NIHSLHRNPPTLSHSGQHGLPRLVAPVALPHGSSTFRKSRSVMARNRCVFVDPASTSPWTLSRSIKITSNIVIATRSNSVPRAAASLRLDVGCPDHVAPLVGFIGEQLAEVGGRARKYSTSQVSESRLHLRVGEGGVDFRVEPIDDFGGCVFGRANPIPANRLVARDEIPDGRDVWQHLQSCRGCHRQRSKLAGP